ncbi:MAG: NAD(P)/FAD-dependent oxidoreductase [Henriciella sp.]|nr:NAD(P)/FAD-dependent oxidoreductase [Henriciella sp.]
MPEATTARTRIEGIDFDPDKIREKYRRERDKRLREEGNEQYVNMVGDFAHYIDDPYIERRERAPLTDHTHVIVIGGGFGGLLAGGRLRDHGLAASDVRLIEKGGDFGGTWYWNRYPGAACDIESYIYLPLLEETGFMPAERYTSAPEILEHSARIADHYGLYDKALLQTEVTGMHWDEARSVWVVETNRDDRLTADFVIMSNGPLNRPKLPGIPGVETFKGHSFHTSRWDYGYTGGDATGNLTGLKDKRVGIIGTGATAVQCVPHVGAAAKQLYVFQRTPSSIDVRDNRPTDPDWAASLEPGWHRKRMENFNTLVSGGYEPVDLVMDGWTDIIRNLLFIASKNGNQDLSPKRLMELAELADHKKMESVRARVDDLVEDEDTAAALKPWYRQFCKRPCFHDEYLQTFNRPNVHLVDTDGKGVDRITENAVIANGQTYEVDCLIYATGFEVGTEYTRRAGYDVTGREGQTLSGYWEEGYRSLHGMHVHNFPNMLVMGVTQSGFTANYPHLLEEQSQHIGYIVSEAGKRQATRVEVTPQAEEAWVQKIIDKAILRQDFFESCTPGYYNNEGQMNLRSRQNTAYGGGPNEFFSILAKWRNAGELEGLTLS